MLASCVPIVFFYIESFYEPFLGVKIQKKPNKSCPAHYIDGMRMGDAFRSTTLGEGGCLLAEGV